MEYPAGLQRRRLGGRRGRSRTSRRSSRRSIAASTSRRPVSTSSRRPQATTRRRAAPAWPRRTSPGVAALIWSARPSLSVAELEAVLRASAVDLGDPGRDNVYGSGRVDAEAALAEAVPSPLPDLEPAPGFTDPLTITFSSPAAPEDAGLAQRRRRLDDEPRRHRRDHPAAVLAARRAVGARTRSSSPTTMSSCSTSRAPSTRPASRSARAIGGTRSRSTRTPSWPRPSASRCRSSIRPGPGSRPGPRQSGATPRLHEGVGQGRLHGARQGRLRVDVAAEEPEQRACGSARRSPTTRRSAPRPSIHRSRCSTDVGTRWSCCAASRIPPATGSRRPAGRSEPGPDPGRPRRARQPGRLTAASSALAAAAGEA